MYTCIICCFETVLDDVVVASASNRCICLRCFARETGTARPLPKALRRELDAVITGLEVA